MKRKQFKALCLVLATALTLSGSGCKIVSGLVKNYLNSDEGGVETEEISPDEEKEKVEEAMAKIVDEEKNATKDAEEKDIDEDDEKYIEIDVDGDGVYEKYVYEDDVDEDEVDEEDTDVKEIVVEASDEDFVLTLSSDWIGKDVTQDQLDDECKQKGFKSATLNADGSVTYVMTPDQHEEVMKGIVDGIKDELDDIVNDQETFKNIVGFECNEDFTRFTVTTSGNYEPLFLQIDSILFFYGGEMYNAFNGTPTNDIEVTWVDENGNVITSFNLNED